MTSSLNTCLSKEINMKKKNLNPLITILLCAFCAVIITILILRFAVGYQYIHNKELGIKFIGMTENGLARDGKLYYANGTRGTLDSETSTIMYNNGEQYTGDLMGFIPHGTGVLKKANGTVYDGTFNMGQCTGQAHVAYKSGDSYDGELVDGTRNGFGTYTSESGAVYIGQFINNVKNGYGYSDFANSSYFIGQYKNSIKDGWGAFLFKNGDIYVGEFQNDKRTGKGIYIWAKSEEYATEFDEMFKSVEFTQEYAEKFFEYFEDGFLLHFTTADNTGSDPELPFWQSFEKILFRSQVECYIGHFKDNLLEGQGKYIWLSGRILESEFVGGLAKEEPETEE